MDQVRPFSAAASAPATPPPKRHWLRISLVIQQVETPPLKLFSVDRGPYSFRVNVAVTGKLLRRLGVLITALIALSHPVLWKAVLFVAQVLATQ